MDYISAPQLPRQPGEQRPATRRIRALPRRVRRLLHGIILLTINAAAAAPATWERLAPLPVGNGGFVSAAIDGEVVVAGGTTWKGETKIWLDPIWVYNPERNAWRETGRLPAPMGYGVTGQSRDTLWFAGGSSGTTTHRTLWKIEKGFSPQLVASLDRGFVYSAGALIGSTLYAVGGTDDQAAVDRAGHALLAINAKTGAITQLADYPEPGLTTAAAAAIGDRLFVFGGGQWDPVRKAVVNHATAYAYSVTKKRWEALPPLPHPGRGYTAVALDDRRILVGGGYRNDEVEFVTDAYLFDIRAQTYTPTTPLPYAAMVGLVKNGEWLYCLGGEDRKRHRTDAVFRIRWSELLPVLR